MFCRDRRKGGVLLVRKLENIYYYSMGIIFAALLAALILSGGGKVRDDAMTEILPITAAEEDGFYTYRFEARDLQMLGDCLAFYTEHQTVTVYADGKEIYQLDPPHSGFGRTPGKCWNFAAVPEGTFWLTVEFTDVYRKQFNAEPEFFAGNLQEMREKLVQDDMAEAIVSLLHIIVGVFMILVWLIINNKAQISRALVFLGMIELCLGVWFLGETDIMLILLAEHRGFMTFLSMLLLMLVIMPFTSFIRELFAIEETVGWMVLYGYNVLGILHMVGLQLAGVADVEEMVFVPYIGFALMVLYVLYAVVLLRKKGFIDGRIRIHIASTLMLLVVIAADLFQPEGPPNLGVASNLSLAIYLATLGGFASAEAMRQLEATKRSLYFEELAYTDISTGFGNRNAYLQDVEAGYFVPGHLMITFDLNELKSTNDRFGHLAGDRYIKDAAALINKYFGPYGKCYRIGGDEFCVSTSKLRMERAEQLLHALCRDQQRYNKESPDVVMGIACGYAAYSPELDGSIEDTRKRADELMYHNKADMKDGLKK